MSIEIKNICCIGAGYVGGPTMAVIANKCPSIQINVVDINEKRIGEWNGKDLNKLPIYEPGLKEYINKCRGKNLHFSTDLEKHISTADMIFISVNTPTKTKGIGAGQASNLKWIEASARQISKYAKGHTTIVEKSTLPVKTALTIKEILNNSTKEKGKTFQILSNPEFLSEGSAINDLENPDRVLIGGENKDAIDSLIKIYLNWLPKEKILTTDLWSSELSKLIANAFLAQRISSINSISALCEKTGANIKQVSLAIGTDSRIGSKFLNSGPGFGGSCFKKDISNLIYICDHYGLNEVSEYWQKVIDINYWQSDRISNLIVNKLFGNLSNKKLSILGFSFKANTNDTRESPAIKICKNLLEEGANLRIYDPRVSKIQINKDLEDSNKNSNVDYGSWICCDSAEDTFKDADATLILTEWDEFKLLDWPLLASKMRRPSWLFDARSIINLNIAKKSGLKIWSIGNGTLIS